MFFDIILYQNLLIYIKKKLKCKVYKSGLDELDHLLNFKNCLDTFKKRREKKGLFPISGKSSNSHSEHFIFLSGVFFFFYL